MRKVKELEKRITEIEAENTRLKKELDGLREIAQKNCKHEFQGAHNEVMGGFYFLGYVYYKHCLICGYKEKITKAEYIELIKSEDKARLESQIAAAKEQLERLEAE